MSRRQPAIVGTVIALTYGKIEILGFDGPWRRELYRPNAVHPSEPWNAEVRERTMIADHTDDSTRHDKAGGRGYDARCSCCYLNITHSARRHAMEAA